ncbi:MAG: nucleoside-diphosphate kinase [Candidatus Parcubacteria bacterium]|nr:MAG: nucleoside-diphosphate kinase [Candidatus Parcubacteria bacterium]
MDINNNLKKFKKERTLVLIKPDGIERGLIGEIISRFERAGLKIVGLGIVRATKNLIDKHYPKTREWIENLGNNFIKTCQENNIKYDLKKDFGVNDVYNLGLLVRKWLIDFMCSGPIVKIAIEGNHAVEVVRKIVGPTLPYKAPPGTIRGDFAIDSPIVANLEKRAIKNLIHASGNIKEAQYELKIWFRKDELID